MKNKLQLTGILLLLVSAVNAQICFRPGYIIKNNGDSLNGLVFYSIDGKFGKICRFKRFDIAREVEYSPYQIRAYGFRNGRCFESKQTGNNRSFFECLVKGPVSLFIIPGKANASLYIDHVSTGFIKLNKGRNDLKGGEHFDDFREILSWLMPGSSPDSVSINTTAYDAASVSSLIRKTAGQSFQPVKTFYPTPDVKYLGDYSVSGINSPWTIGLTGGYQFLIIHIPGNNLTRYFKKADFNTSYRPVGGLFINRRLSRKSELASVDLSFLYVTDSYYGYAEYEQTYDFRDDMVFEFSSLQIPLSLKLMLGKKRVHPYCKLGVYKSFLLSQSYNRYSEKQYGTDVYTDLVSDFSYEDDMGIQGAVGVDIPLGNARNLSFEAGYMQGRQPLKGKTEAYSTVMNTKVISIILKINL